VSGTAETGDGLEARARIGQGGRALGGSSPTRASMSTSPRRTRSGSTSSIAVSDCRWRLNAWAWLKPATDFEPDRKDEWFLSTGFIMLLSDPDTTGHDAGPQPSCRVSLDEENMSEVLVNLLDFTDSLVMELGDGQGHITREELDVSVRRSQRAFRNIVGMIGKLED